MEVEKHPFALGYSINMRISDFCCSVQPRRIAGPVDLPDGEWETLVIPEKAGVLR